MPIWVSLDSLGEKSQSKGTDPFGGQGNSLKQSAWVFFLLLSLGLTVSEAFAQQTIFNVPSADVTPKGQLYLEHESQFRPWGPHRFWLGTHYFAYGVGHGTEIDATVSNVSAPASDNIVLGIGLKKNFELFHKRFPRRDFRWTVGNITPISLQGQGVGTWTYTHLSGRIPKIDGRVTAGVSAGTRQLFGRNTVGFIGGYEQPVTKRLNIIADWFSGTHSNGYFIPGFSYVIKGPLTLFVGYQIPNTKRVGPSGLVVELSTFVPTRPPKKGPTAELPSNEKTPSN